MPRSGSMTLMTARRLKLAAGALALASAAMAAGPERGRPGRYLVAPAPVYPAASLRLGEEGTVWVRAWIRADGSVGERMVRRSSTLWRLDAAALAAFDRVRVEPPTDAQGNVVEAWFDAPITFVLDDAPAPAAPPVAPAASAPWPMSESAEPGPR